MSLVDQPDLGDDYLSEIMNQVYDKRVNAAGQEEPFMNHFRMNENTVKIGSVVQREIDLLENTGLNPLNL